MLKEVAELKHYTMDEAIQFDKPQQLIRGTKPAISFKHVLPAAAAILQTFYSEVITKVLVFFLFVRWQIAPQGQTFSFSLSNSYNNLEKILENIFANSNNGCIFDPSNTMKCLGKTKRK